MKNTRNDAKELEATLKELFRAIEAGDLKRVRQAVLKITHVEVKGKVPWRNERPSSWPPLLAAVKYGRFEVAKYLISVGADIRARVDESEWDDLMRGATALIIASRLGDLKMVGMLLEAGAGVNECTENRESVLCHAAISGNSDLVDLLLKKGAELKEENYDWVFTAVTRARRVDIFRMLVEERNVPVKKIPWLLPTAAKFGAREIVRYLVERSVNLESVSEEDHRNALMNACTYGHLDVVEYLLAEGANPEAVVDGMTAKKWALKTRQPAAVKLLTAAAKASKAKPSRKKPSS